MYLDCPNIDSWSVEGQSWAADNGYCQSADGFSPQDERFGDCGSNSLYIYNEGGGEALVELTAVSSLGPINAVSWRVDYFNYSTNTTPTANGGSDWVGGSTTWYRPVYKYTGAGFVVATLTQATVILTSGGQCSTLWPSDSATIT